MKNKILPLEIAFSIVIIVIIVSIITLVCLQIRLEIEMINKNSEASLLVSNILENINTRSFENIDSYINELSGVGVSKNLENGLQNIIIYGEEYDGKFFGTDISEDFIVDFSIQNNSDFDILKDIDIEVSYRTRGGSKTYAVSTVIEREKISECNTPVLSDEYFESLNINSNDYEIIPIKYSKNNDSFVVTTKDDPEWYNYSSKRWAKVVIFFENENLKELFIDEHEEVKQTVTVQNITFNIEDYIYVWIPNFSIKDEVSYFRYGTSKRAIRLDFVYSNNKYLYLNKVAEEIKDISEDCSFDGIYGVWEKLYNEEDEYYKNFNATRFAPINLY